MPCDCRPDSAQAHVNYGLACRRGQVERGHCPVPDCLGIYPQYSLAETHLGLALVVGGRSTRPRGTSGGPRTIDPENAWAYDNLGNVLIRQGRLQEAVDALERSVALEATLAAAFNDLAVALCQLRRFDEAASRYRRAIESIPMTPRPARILACSMPTGRRS